MTSLVSIFTKAVRRVETLGQSSKDSKQGRGDDQSSQQQRRRTPPKPAPPTITVDTYINTSDTAQFQDTTPYAESNEWQKVVQSIGKMLDTKV